MHDYSMVTSNLIETSPKLRLQNKKDYHKSYLQTGLRSLYKQLEIISFENIIKSGHEQELTPCQKPILFVNAEQNTLIYRPF